MDLAKIMCQSLRPNSAAAQDRARATVDRYLAGEAPVVIFSKSFCPACDTAKEILRKYTRSHDASVAVPVAVLEMDVELSEEDCAATQDRLWDLTGIRTVPRIFIGGRSVGGKDDLLRLQESGDLEALLGEAAARAPRTRTTTTTTARSSAAGWSAKETAQEEEEAAAAAAAGGEEEVKRTEDDDGKHESTRDSLLSVLVTFEDQCCTVQVMPQMTGLQLKSLVLSQLGLKGGFGDFFLTCEGKTFPSRGAVDTVPELRSKGGGGGGGGATVHATLVLARRKEGEAKHVGET